MIRSTLGCLAVSLLPIAAMASEVASANRHKLSSWIFDFASDAFFESDDHFSSGVELQRHHPLRSSLHSAADSTFAAQYLARWFLEQERDHLRDEVDVTVNFEEIIGFGPASLLRSVHSFR